MTTNKPEVKRYDCTSSGFQYCYGCYTMKEDEMGDYVEWETYEALQAECEKLRSILIDLKDWDCDVRGGFLSIPVDLRRRMQEALDSARHEPGHDSDGMVE